MRFAAAVLGALALVCGLPPSAFAAPHAVPPPTFSSASYVQRRTLPASFLAGSWKSDSTISNRLTVSGATATGTTSTVDAGWTSSWGWTRPGRPAVSLVIDVRHKPLLPGLTPSAWRYELDERVPGGRWIRNSVVVSQPYDPVLIADWHIHDLISSSKRFWVQFRVRFHADINSTTVETMTVQPHLLTTVT